MFCSSSEQTARRSLYAPNSMSGEVPLLSAQLPTRARGIAHARMNLPTLACLISNKTAEAARVPPVQKLFPQTLSSPDDTRANARIEPFETRAPNMFA
jgi:hypothetical protein